MMPRLLILIILLATLLGGCTRNRYEPAKRAEVVPAAAGKRVVINDETGQPVLKIRARKNAWKVYDENFQAAGFVRWTNTPENTAPYIETLVREKVAQFQSVGSNDEVFELSGHLRIEKIDLGWAVFDQEAKLLGLFEYSTAFKAAEPENAEQENAEAQPTDTLAELSESSLLAANWTLRTAYNTPVLWTASHEKNQLIARHKDGKSITGNATHLTAPALLAGELEALSALERAALAAWFIHMMPGA